MRFVKNNFLYLLGILLLIGIAGIYYRNKISNQKLNLNPSLSNNNIETENPNSNAQPTKPVEVLAENLNVPWEIIFLPNNRYLLTERVGNLVVLDSLNNTVETTQVPGVLARGEGGLMGAVLDPNFSDNNYLYLYFTYLKNGDVTNKVVRYVFEDNSIKDEFIVIDDIRGSNNHNGGRIAFGPDGKLYIGTGDASIDALAQDNTVLEGKVLRINADGSIPADNPFGNAVYSYGHRNVQGLAWDSSGQLYSTEHGPSGTQSGWDEINKIVSGGNYGWPEVRGDSTNPDFLNPEIHSGSDDTWAPAGIAYYNNVLYFAGLRGAALYAYDLDTNTLEEHFKSEYGRIRAVVLGNDQLLYITTSNNDGRGRPKENDDKLIRIDPKQL